MKLIGRTIWEAADRSEYYPLIWDPTLSIALLPGGACTVRQGGNAYAFQGVTTPVAYTDAPGVAAASLDTLASAIHALPVPVDNSAALAALQVSLSAVASRIPPDVSGLIQSVLTAISRLPDPTAAVAALAAAVNKLPTYGSAGAPVFALPNGQSGGVYIPFNTTDPAPTAATAGKSAPVAASGTASVFLT